MNNNNEKRGSSLKTLTGMFRNTAKTSGKIYYNGTDRDTGIKYFLYKNDDWVEGGTKPYFSLCVDETTLPQAQTPKPETPTPVKFVED
tara:strand:+ start:1420 stop:1683 length:264 start_codon:yes stop_codon:yes gene_type:complete